MKFPDIENEYKERIKDFKRLETESVYTLKDGVSSIKTSAILSRIKSFESFNDKIKREDYDNPFEQINDILGIRIVALFRSDLQELSEIIHYLFEVVKEDNKLDNVPVDSFGYFSIHFIVKLNPTYKGPRYDGLHNIIFEIQIRTIAMDAWSTISHYLDYKKPTDIPKELRKDFHALSGLFYLADTHFEIFYDHFLTSKESSKVGIEALEDCKGQEINLDTLKAYLNKRYPNRKGTNLRTTSELIKELHEFGCQRLDELNEKLDLSEEAFKLFEKKGPPSNSELYTPVGVVRLSLTIIDKEFRYSRRTIMTIEILKKAIQQKSVISFEYNKPGKVTSKRIGNPHAVFTMCTSDGKESTKVHIVQTSGVSDSEQPFPSFRMFNIKDLSNVTIYVTDPNVTFEESPDYNPEWDGYQSVIAKI